MGAIEVTGFGLGKYKNHYECFEELVEEAIYDTGNDYYSGGINNANSPRLLRVFPRYGSKSFYKWVDSVLEDACKGDCFCIELKGAALKKAKSGRWKGKRGIKAFFFFAVVPY